MKRYIYNIPQGCYIANRGAKLLSVSIGNKGDLYMLFQYDKNFEIAFGEWASGNTIKECKIN